MRTAHTENSVAALIEKPHLPDPRPQVMLDADLTRLYEVETQRPNEAVRRNQDRIPEHFMFQLFGGGRLIEIANCDFKRGRGGHYRPYTLRSRELPVLYDDG